MLIKLQQNLRLERILSMIWRSSPRLMLANLGLVAVQAALPLGLLLLIKQVFDAVEQGAADGDMGSAIASALLLVAGAAGVALLQALFSSIGKVVGDWQAQSVTDYMFGVLHSKSIEVDLGYYETPSYRDTLFRAQQQAPYRPNAIVSGLRDIARNGLSLLIMGGLLMSLHWAIFPILILVSIPGVILRLTYARKVYVHERSVTGIERMANYVNQMMAGPAFAKEIRLLNIGSLFEGKFGGLRDHLRRARLWMTAKASTAEFVGEVVSVVGMFAVMGFMVEKTFSGEISNGDLVMYFLAMQRAWQHFGSVLRGLSSLYEHSLFLRDLYEFLDTKAVVIDPETPKAVPKPMRKGITLENVTFQYPAADKPALTDISLTIEKGQHIAIVGRNGSGKSTLTKIFCRLYDPKEGTVRIDGIDMRDFKVTDLREQLSILQQDFVRYQETVAKNIAYGRIHEDVTQEQIEQAARSAGAHEFIVDLPEGYDTILGTTFEESRELSVGQWQRLALARTIMRDGQIVILDEPTSSMDAQSALTALRSIQSSTSNATTILISHRLSAVQDADRIFLLENGRLTEEGTHDELVRLGGSYAQLFDIQNREVEELAVLEDSSVRRGS